MQKWWDNFVRWVGSRISHDFIEKKKKLFFFFFSEFLRRFNASRNWLLNSKNEPFLHPIVVCEMDNESYKNENEVDEAQSDDEVSFFFFFFRYLSSMLSVSVITHDHDKLMMICFRNVDWDYKIIAQCYTHSLVTVCILLSDAILTLFEKYVDQSLLSWKKKKNTKVFRKTVDKTFATESSKCFWKPHQNLSFFKRGILFEIKKKRLGCICILSV